MHWAAWVALLVFVFLLTYDPRVGTIQKFVYDEPKISPGTVDGKA